MVGKGSKAAPLWTTAQEDCLIASIERVQGPFWAKILLLHGTNGTESNILGGRSNRAIALKSREVYQRRGLLAPRFLTSSHPFKLQDENDEEQLLNNEASDHEVAHAKGRTPLSPSSSTPE